MARCACAVDGESFEMLAGSPSDRWQVRDAESLGQPADGRKALDTV
jgi:hypothetical protein